jgi:hypothetical protein
LPLGWLAFAPAAQGGTPFVAIAETGAVDPDVAVDQAGNAHVVWESDQPGGGPTENRLRYCAIPPGGSACVPATVRTLFPATEPSQAIVGPPSVFVTAANEVIVVSAISVPGDAGTRVFRSSESFAPRIIGPLLDEHALGPGEAISLLSGNAREYFLGPLTGAPANSQRATLPGEPGQLVLGEGTRVAAFAGTRALVVRDTSSGTQFTASNGSDPNSSANWSPAQPITPAGDNPIVASGPAGVVLAYETGSAGNSQFQARTFDGAAFGPPVPISAAGDPIFPDLYADQKTGAFHFLYSDDRRDLRWVTSANGRDWTAANTIVTAAQKPDVDPAAIAGGADHGLIVWNGNPDTGPQTGAGKVWGAWLPELRDQPNSVSVGGRRTVVFGDARHTLRLAIPSCTADPVKARATLARKRRRSRLRTRVLKVVFRLAGERRTDRSAPYRKTIAMPDAEAGGEYTLTSIVTLRVERAERDPKRETLRLTRRFRLCPGGFV